MIWWDGRPRPPPLVAQAFQPVRTNFSEPLTVNHNQKYPGLLTLFLLTAYRSLLTVIMSQ